MVVIGFMETNLKANFDHDNDQFRVKTKPLAWRMTAQPHNRFVLFRGRGIYCVMETRLKARVPLTDFAGRWRNFRQRKIFKHSLLLLSAPNRDSAKRGLTQFWELITVIPCAAKYLKR